MASGRRARSQRGFTLLELLITLTVTTIGLIGLLSLHLSVARGNDGASRSAEAQQLGTSEVPERYAGLSRPASCSKVGAQSMLLTIVDRGPGTTPGPVTSTGTCASVS